MSSDSNSTSKSCYDYKRFMSLRDPHPTCPRCLAELFCHIYMDLLAAQFTGCLCFTLTSFLPWRKTWKNFDDSPLSSVQPTVSAATIHLQHHVDIATPPDGGAAWRLANIPWSQGRLFLCPNTQSHHKYLRISIEPWLFTQITLPVLISARIFTFTPTWMTASRKVSYIHQLLTQKCFDRYQHNLLFIGVLIYLDLRLVCHAITATDSAGGRTSSVSWLQHKT